MVTRHLPAIVPSAESWTLAANTQTFTSELNGATQTESLPGDQWQATLTFKNLSGRKARAMAAFIASLQGRSGRFYLTPTDRQLLGSAEGSGWVNGAGQKGLTLVTGGWAPSQPELFAAGDYFEVNGELKMVTETVTSSDTGAAVINFMPPIRVSPPDGGQIIIDKPSCIMKLASDAQATWDINVPMIYAFSLACEEALDI